MTQTSQHLYRIDRFKVPVPARDEFLQTIREIQRFLRALPECVRDVILEQAGGPGAFNIITLVEWESAEAVEAAKKAAAARYKATGFNPQELLTRLRIEADTAVYLEIT